METSIAFTADDIAYITSHFVSLENPVAGRPEASYVLPDGRKFYPKNYPDLEADEERFKARLSAECAALNIEALDPEETWKTYLTGIYSVCLRAATPENIARKAALLRKIDGLLAEPQEGDAAWFALLTDAVNALDELEMPFSPDHDRRRFGRPPTRDTYIRDLRRKLDEAVI